MRLLKNILFGLLIAMLWHFFMKNVKAQETDYYNNVFEEDSSYYTSNTYSVDSNALFLEYAYDGKLLKIKELVSKGIDVNCTSYDGVTALMYATQRGHNDIVYYLVKNGAELDKTNYSGRTALFDAVFAQNDTLCEFLIRSGANINIQDNYGASALMYAASYGYFLIADMLIYYDANIHLKDENACNALMASCLYGKNDLIELLLKKGAGIDSCDTDGNSPLMYAAMGGDSLSVEILIGNGVNINYQNKNGNTAISIAVEYNNNYALSALLKHNPDLLLGKKNKRTTYTPLYYAKLNNNRQAVKMLKEAGAPKILLPDFSNATLGYGFNWNHTDYMYDLHGGLFDPVYNFEIVAGYAFRWWKTRVLYTNNNIDYMQYWEWRSYFYIGLRKDFNLYTNKNGRSLGLSLGAKELYTFGNLRGTNTKAKRAFLASPLSGLYWQVGGVRLHADYEYTDFRIYGTSPHRIVLGLRGYITGKKNEKIEKAYWLE